MTDESRKTFRREQTRLELESVSAAVRRWLDEYDDPLGLHQTQLRAIGSVLNTAARELRANLDAMDVAGSDVAGVYDLCRDYDEAVVWLQRLWEYLKEKLEQRDARRGGEALARMLKAADEVVWSCYHEVLGKAGAGHGAAPLAYVEPEYSPATIQTDEPLPVSLMLNAELDFLEECLESLPIPVLRLPPACVKAPWWLVYVAHEIGHHVQYDLDLVGHFREGLAAAARARGFSPAEADELWGRWGEEVFADVFSILMMGPWAVLAMAEAEVGSPARMVRRKTTYPAPVIRLALMERVARKLKLDTSGALGGLDPKAVAGLSPLTARDYEVVEGAADFALGELPGGRGRLRDLCSFDADVLGGSGAVEYWSLLLSADAPLVLDSREAGALKTARQVVCGSLRAWSELRARDESEWARGRETIRSQTVAALLQSGPRETRADVLPDGTQPDEKGRSLARLLLRARGRAGGRGGEGG